MLSYFRSNSDAIFVKLLCLLAACVDIGGVSLLHYCRRVGNIGVEEGVLKAHWK